MSLNEQASYQYATEIQERTSLQANFVTMPLIIGLGPGYSNGSGFYDASSWVGQPA